MSAIPIYSGHPWSPYLVFVKSTAISDDAILNALDLGAYVKIPAFDRRLSYLAIGRDENWTHLADNFHYSHWFSNDFKNAVSKLGEIFELFSFSVGDIDLSFDLKYYCAGNLRRRFEWEDPYNSGGRLKEQFGAPLDQEDAIIIPGKDPLDGLWRVAEALGIESDYTRLDLQLYAPRP